MNWEYIGIIADTVAVLAVIISVIYLAGQIRLSNRIAIVGSEAQSRALSATLYSSILVLADDAPLLIELLKEEPNFTPAQKAKAFTLARAFGNAWALYGSAYSSKLIDEQANQDVIYDLRAIFMEYPDLKVAFRELSKEYVVGNIDPTLDIRSEITKQLAE